MGNQVVHRYPLPGYDVTICCGRRLADLGPGSLSTSDEENVTCGESDVADTTDQSHSTEPYSVYGITLTRDFGDLCVSIHTSEGEVVPVAIFADKTVRKGEPADLGYVSVSRMRKAVMVHRDKAVTDWLETERTKRVDTYGPDDEVAAGYRQAAAHIVLLREQYDQAWDQADNALAMCDAAVALNRHLKEQARQLKEQLATVYEYQSVNGIITKEQTQQIAERTLRTMLDVDPKLMVDAGTLKFLEELRGLEWKGDPDQAAKAEADEEPSQLRLREPTAAEEPWSPFGVEIPPLSIKPLLPAPGSPADMLSRHAAAIGKPVAAALQALVDTAKQRSVHDTVTDSLRRTLDAGPMRKPDGEWRRQEEILCAECGAEQGAYHNHGCKDHVQRSDCEMCIADQNVSDLFGEPDPVEEQVLDAWPGHTITNCTLPNRHKGSCEPPHVDPRANRPESHRRVKDQQRKENT